MQRRFIILQTYIFLIFLGIHGYGQPRTDDCRKPEPLNQLERDEVIKNVQLVFQGDETAETNKLSDLDIKWYGYYLCLKNPQSGVVDSAKARMVDSEAEERKLQNTLSLLELSGEDSETNLVKAQIAFLKLKLDDALKYAEKAVELDEKNFEAHYVLARLKTDLSSVKKSIELNSTFAPAYILKIEILINQAASLNEIDKRKEKYKTVLASIESLLSLSNTPDIEFWKEQRESLIFFLGDKTNVNTTFSNSAKTQQSLENRKFSLLSVPRARYSELARVTQTQGTINLRITFGEDGRVKNILALTYLPYGLTRQAIEAAKQIKFEPEIKNGVPVSINKTVEYGFNIY